MPAAVVDEDEFEATSDGFSALRKAYRALKKDYSSLESEVAAFRADKQKLSVTSILTAKGLNPLLADFYRDEDTSEQAVSAWADKYASLFGGKPKTDEPESPGTGEPQQEAGGGAVTPPEDQAMSRRLNAVMAGSPPAAGLDATVKSFMDAGSKADLLKAIQAARSANS